MQVVIRHENGKEYVLPASQVVVYSDDGYPVAMSYEHGEMIIHTDRGHDDFDHTLNQLKVAELSHG